MINTVLIDARTPDTVVSQAMVELSQAKVVGIDCETEDSNAHDGLKSLRNKKKLIFDHRRSTMTGFSWYVEGSDTAYYANLGHADVENRLPDSFVHMWNETIPSDSMSIAHNAPYEIINFKLRHNIEFPNIICSMQMAVSHHGPDNYDHTAFRDSPINNIRPILGDILENFGSYSSKEHGRNMTAAQSFIFGQWGGKATKAAHSYNGYISTIAYGYGLKQLTDRLFDYSMTTFDQVIGDKEHMGQLTGEETASYGAEDAYWCVRVFRHFYDEMLAKTPAALVAFLKQENPMVHVYAEAAMEGLVLDVDAVYERQALERENVAQLLREIKATLKKLLPFEDQPNSEMIRLQPYYEKSWQKKRQQIIDWVKQPDSDDTFEMVTQVSNPIGNAWANIAGNGRLNINYWQTARVILYDLLAHKPIRIAGKVASDSEARGRVALSFIGDEVRSKLLLLMSKMSGVEQAVKLYITPYTKLIDPDTGKVYPTINSLLATRRMAMSNPNAMQLAKYGDSSYVRSYFKPDKDNHVVLSADWSGVELVLIGEYSGDPEFARCFGQIPYDDLHSGAAADCLAVKTLPGITEEEFLGFKKGLNPNNRELKHLQSGEILTPQKYFKYIRTTCGKGANFNYWYSGALGTVGDNLGWTGEEMWAGVDNYRNRFALAEEWRVALCDEIVKNGYITLPDGHRRERFEATADWWMMMGRKFAQQSAQKGVLEFGEQWMKQMVTRAKNQAVNTMIQGSCAGMAKQAILKMREKADLRYCRFMMPIHDEVVFSVDKDYAMDFIPLLKEQMNDQPTYVQNLPLHCTVALGKTFGVNDQIELDEASPIEGVIPKEYDGLPLPDNIVEDVIRYVMESK